MVPGKYVRDRPGEVALMLHASSVLTSGLLAQPRYAPLVRVPSVRMQEVAVSVQPGISEDEVFSEVDASVAVWCAATQRNARLAAGSRC